jgi:hypothetical protein
VRTEILFGALKKPLGSKNAQWKPAGQSSPPVPQAPGGPHEQPLAPGNDTSK